MEDLEFVNGGTGRHFTIILNKALRDKRLTWRAKGILAGCLSHHNSFKFTRSWIIEHGAEGRDAIISALSELRNLGYLKNAKIRNDSGQIVGEHYVFTDRPSASGDATPDSLGVTGDPEEPMAEPTGVLKNRTPGNQRPGKPDAGKPGRNRRPLERRPIEEDQVEERPPIAPRSRPGRSAVALPEWLEPHRTQLVAWLENRRRKHKLEPALTTLTIRGLEYARSLGVLADYCEHAAEKHWQSLGFVGYKEYVEKLAQERGLLSKNQQQAKPAMAPIVYTLN